MGKIEKAENVLKDLIADNNAGQTLSLDDSIDRIISTMKFGLEEIIVDNQWNGFKAIKSDSEKAQYLEATIGQTIEAAATLRNAVSEHGGWADNIILSSEGRNALGQPSVNLFEIEAKLTRAVNHWKSEIEEKAPEAYDLIHMPFRVNESAYEQGETIKDTRAVVHQEVGGFVANSFNFTAGEAEEHMTRHHPDAQPRGTAPVGSILKPQKV